MLQCHAVRLLLCASSKRTLAYIGGVSFHGNVVTYILCMQLAILRVLGKCITCRWVAVKRIMRYLKGVYVQSWTYLQTPEELQICGILISDADWGGNDSKYASGCMCSWRYKLEEQKANKCRSVSSRS